MNGAFVLFLFLFSPPQAFAKVQAPARAKLVMKAAAKTETPWQHELRLVTKMFRQADAVTREMWWIVANDRKALGQSPFGRLQRALMKETGAKIKKGLSLKCDSYKVKNLVVNLAVNSEAAEMSVMRPLKVEVYEACKKNLLLATWILEKNDEIQVDFYPVNLSDDLGLTASVMNRKTRCDLKFSGSILQTMDCKDWVQDRGKNEIIELSIFKYTADRDSVLQIKGVVLEGMNPKSKIESKVPLKGRIVVTEVENEGSEKTEILKATEPPKPLGAAAVARPAKKPSADMPGVEIPEGAEGAPPATLDPQIAHEPPTRGARKAKPDGESLPNPDYIEGEGPRAPMKNVSAPLTSQQQDDLRQKEYEKEQNERREQQNSGGSTEDGSVR